MADEESGDLSLSQAILAPLNAIFKAQVQASRAFLSFLLQMGFRHVYTEDEKKKLRESGTPESIQALADIEAERVAREKIRDLSQRLKALNVKEDLTADETRMKESLINQLKDLNLNWGPLHQQPVEYFDSNGVEHTIFVPNLALLPIKPLGIERANFQYELRVTDSSKTSGMNKTEGASEKRPWFLIDPKRIEGNFASSQKEGSTDKTIKIDITVSAMDMPYGLHKLLASMTNMTQDGEKIGEEPPTN